MAANPDVKASGIAPRVHFELYGRQEGRGQVTGPPDAFTMRITVVGNCQAPVLAACLRVMLPDAEIHGVHLGVSSTETVAISDLVLLQTEFAGLRDDRAFISERRTDRVRLWPTFYYAGFHPDLVYAQLNNKFIDSPLDEYNSALTLYGWHRGLSVDQVIRLFREDVFDRLGYLEYITSADAHLIENFNKADLDGKSLLDGLKDVAPFCHAVNHPSLPALARVAEAVLNAVGLAPAVRAVDRFLNDPLLTGPVWPIYPTIADRFGLDGSYEFKTSGTPGRILDLERFVTGSFERYRGHNPSDLRCERLIDQADRYRDLERLTVPSHRRGSNPYAKLPDYQFWRRAVVQAAPADLDPVIKPGFRLTPGDRIATAGSCFAQHIARTLIERGFNYHVTEPGADEANLFSARFGNIYSARQLLQLAHRAYGLFKPRDTAWLRLDGRYVDPFRPQVDISGHSSEQAVVDARVEHFAAVRRMFEESDLFIFTVGLTEIWESSVDGAVFPIAPGVVAQPPDPSAYRFTNMTAEEVRRDLEAFVIFIRERNPNLRILLTVSPVPLVATYEDQHVLVSTTYSKSALRAAAGELCRHHDRIEYFPSYEIITSWVNGGTYFEADRRSVSESGVAHVMRVFNRNYMTNAAPADAHRDAALHMEFNRSSKILCDEEALDAAG
ncbi:GSCFA domain-containing protein [Methylobacterium sp. J-030]|uniref:GSCFA domain-containing protein n=1 Tax=Methylobacterium sp. J-030 TaxID=2836627 RepID=UPI001FB9A836|nr:GSCFA domain-containing protein [Methylobacterium sp. J-030]MCJ2067677.1 GSCFA domain-containing protein [Methylobacterium sp. J-030]